jgi:hypothetical protein
MFRLFRLEGKGTERPAPASQWLYRSGVGLRTLPPSGAAGHPFFVGWASPTNSRERCGEVERPRGETFPPDGALLKPGWREGNARERRDGSPIIANGETSPELVESEDRPW